MIPAPVARALAAALGSPVAGEAPRGGGSIASAHAVRLADGREIFLKTHASLPARAFALEARGLAWLAAPGAIAVPEVLAVGRDDAPFLALALVDVDPRPPRRVAERLGRELAALHRAGADAFGHDEDNFLATLPQANAPCPDAAAFHGQRRLAPLVRRARDAGLLGAGEVARFDALIARLPGLVGPPEPPSRLHGDLWGGNWIAGRDGRPYLVDPAVHGGPREIDLAMMQLFGGFPEATFAAYDEAWPRAPGHEERVALWQLYPLLAHLVLFGAGYRAEVEAALRRYA